MTSLRRNKYGVYYADYRDADGKRHRKTLATHDLAEAEEGFEELVHKILPAQAESAGRVTLTGMRETYCTIFLAAHSKNVVKSADYALGSFVDFAQKAGVTEPSGVTPELVGAWLASLMSAGLSPNSSRTHLSYLKAAWHRCVKTPIEWPRLPRQQPVIEVLTVKQVGQVFAAVDRYAPALGPLIRFLAATGWRVGDALALEHKHVDTFAQRATLLQGKTKAPFGVHLSPDALHAIHKADTREGVVFRQANGRPWPYSSFRQQLARACAKAGIEFRVHAHLFRHTWATRQLARGMPLPDVARALGHASKLTTLAHYGHALPDAAQDYIDSYQADEQDATREDAADGQSDGQSWAHQGKGR